MPSQPEAHQASQCDHNGTNSDAVRTRVSELLDNATVAPVDEYGRDDFVRNVAAGDESETDVLEDTPGIPPIDGDATDKVARQSGSAFEEAAVEETDGDDIATESAPTADSVEASAQTYAADAPLASDPPGTRAEPPEMGEDGEESGPTAVDATSDVSVDDTASYEPTGSGVDQISPTTVRIRGRPGGVLVEIDHEGEWKEILELLEERLAAAEGFFRGGKAVIEVGPRDVYEDELRKARDMLARHDMTLAVVRSTSDLTLQSSLLLGLSTSSQAERPVEADRGMAPVVPITQPKSPYFVYNGTLRSGQILRKSESIVIVGDVNPGAKVISAGDVMVWGRLRGMAYAGATGNKGALVAAIEFAPTQLRIASVTAVPPDAPKSRGIRFWKKREQEKRPEVAHVTDGRIVVEPWDDSRPGRPKLSRR